MLGAQGFDCDWLFSEPDFARFSRAAVASVAAASAEPFQDALGSFPGEADIERAAFAASIQGVAPLLATSSDLDLLPGDLAEFLRVEQRQSAARSRALLTALLQIQSALLFEGIQPVALKGAALLLSGAAGPGLRPMADLDLLLADPATMEKATRALGAIGWKLLFDTRRHRVFAREAERIVRPGCEDPENPIRVELHYSLRIPVLGRMYDVTHAILASAEPVKHEGERFLIAAGNALRRHLLVHAAEDFAAAGLRGVQAHDFRLLSRREGPLRIALSEADRKAGLAPLAFSARAIERLFPGSFAPEFLAMLCRNVPGLLLERADALPPLRKTRPPRGWTKTALSLVESPAAKVRLLARTAFPPLEEVRINVAPEATGLTLALAWLRILGGRFRNAFGRRQASGPGPPSTVVLRAGTVRCFERFGPGTVNRGAVLFCCEWDGGVFESGVLWSGIFRSGTFRGGVFRGGWWMGGVFEGGFWDSGYGPDGRYRPRGEAPRP